MFTELMNLMVSKYLGMSKGEEVAFWVLVVAYVLFFWCIKSMPRAGRHEGDGE